MNSRISHACVRACVCLNLLREGGFARSSCVCLHHLRARFLFLREFSDSPRHPRARSFSAGAFSPCPTEADLRPTRSRHFPPRARKPPRATSLPRRVAQIVGVWRERSATVESYARWTEPGGAEGSTASRDHWRPHDGTRLQTDEWDLTFPKFPDDAPDKLGAIGAYYDHYDRELKSLQAEFPDRVRLFKSPQLFQSADLQRQLFKFLQRPHLEPLLGINLNAQSYAPIIIEAR